MTPARRFLLATLWLTASAICLARAVSLRADPIAVAQVAGESTDDSSADDDLDPRGSVFFRAERTSLKRLAMSRKLIAGDRYAEAIRYLGAILESDEDAFLPPNEHGEITSSLKSEAQRLIGQMSPQGRRLYELEFGALAAQMLRQAVTTADIGALAKISGRYFHTQAGYEATLLLGLDHFDHGRTLAGALTLRRLRDSSPRADQFEPALSLALATCWAQAAMPEQARQTLVALRQRYPRNSVRIADKQTRLFDKDEDALDWLANLIGPVHPTTSAESYQWLMFGGDSSRNAATVGGAPLLSMCWRIPTADDPVVQDNIEELCRDDSDRPVPSVPALSPLAVDGVVVMRTAWNLLAVDSVTGKRLWEVPMESPIEPATAMSARAASVSSEAD